MRGPLRAVCLAATLVAASGFALAGCGSAAAVGAEVAAVQMRLERVLGDGAYDCAPRELALARAHLAFARSDRDRGELGPAREQLRLAGLNARAAERLSPRTRCAPASGVAEPIPAPVRGTGPDRDGDGVSDDSDRCPGQAEDVDGFEDQEGCPEADNDLDGVLNGLDQCPLEPEDVDGQLDKDGCPDVDADSDGVQDGLDRCPVEPGAAANQGCPRVRYRGLELTPNAVRVLEPVLFEEGTATLRAVSTAVLDALVELLHEHPSVRLEVQGHTDSQGDDAANLALSETRAQAVVRYLVDHGVEGTRLTPKGYGETRPMESNRTSQGREINRRIELIRTDGGS